MQKLTEEDQQLVLKFMWIADVVASKFYRKTHLTRNERSSASQFGLCMALAKKPRPTGNLVKYIFACCRNQVMNDMQLQLSKKKIVIKTKCFSEKEEEELVCKSISHVEEIINKDEVGALKIAIEKLPGEAREIINLHMGGMQVKDIAKKLHTRKDNIAESLRATFKELRRDAKRV